MLARVAQAGMAAEQAEQCVEMLERGFLARAWRRTIERSLRFERARYFPASQGAPTAARPTISAFAPESASIAFASSRSPQSPLTTTEIEMDSTIARTAAQSARPA